MVYTSMTQNNQFIIIVDPRDNRFRLFERVQSRINETAMFARLCSDDKTVDNPAIAFIDFVSTHSDFQERSVELWCRFNGTSKTFEKKTKNE